MEPDSFIVKLEVADLDKLFGADIGDRIAIYGRGGIAPYTADLVVVPEAYVSVEGKPPKRWYSHLGIPTAAIRSMYQVARPPWWDNRNKAKMVTE